MIGDPLVSRKCGFVVTALLMGCGLLLGQNQPQFNITEIGILPGWQASQGTAISNSGVVVGFSSSSGFSFSPTGTSGTSEGWVYTNGALTDLGTNGQSVTIPLSVNDPGQVVGLIVGSSGASSQFFYQNGKFQNLQGFPSAGVPFAINDAGQISGTLNPGPAGQAAGIWNGNSEIPLGLPAGAVVGWANGLSANGQIAGAAASSSSTIVPVVWINGQPRTFTLPAGFSEGMALAVNNAGVAVGFIFSPGSSNTHAALFSNGAAVDLGAPSGAQGSVATGINDSGWVVGFSTSSGIDTSGPASGFSSLTAFTSPTQSSHAFLWINSTIYDLNQLVPSGSGWVLSYAAGINNSGQIVGTGFHNGQQTAFVLTPISAAPGPAITGIVSGGTNAPTISSNGWFSIYGKNFTTSSRPAFAGVSNVYSTNLAQTCVQVGNVLAQLNYVSATQINALAPSLPAGKAVPISVISNCGTADATAALVVVATVLPQSPGFLFWSQNASGQNPVIAVEVANGALVGPRGALPGVVFVPASQGDLLTIYYANVGGAGASSVTVGGQFANLIDLGAVPIGGLSPITFVVPHGLTPGNQPIVVTINGVASAPGAFLTVGL
jgi:uncharacterized protein (TIGR03437 family)